MVRFVSKLLLAKCFGGMSWVDGRYNNSLRKPFSWYEFALVPYLFTFNIHSIASLSAFLICSDLNDLNKSQLPDRTVLQRQKTSQKTKIWRPEVSYFKKKKKKKNLLRLTLFSFTVVKEQALVFWLTFWVFKWKTSNKKFLLRGDGQTFQNQYGVFYCVKAESIDLL